MLDAIIITVGIVLATCSVSYKLLLLMYRAPDRLASPRDLDHAPLKLKSAAPELTSGPADLTSATPDLRSGPAELKSGTAKLKSSAPELTS